MVKRFVPLTTRTLMIADYKGGMSARKIAQKHGWSKSFVDVLLRRKGIRRRRRPVSAEIKKAILKDYQAGHEINEIARKRKVSESTVHRQIAGKCNRLKVVSRKSERAIVEDYRRDKRLREISATHGVCKHRIMKMARLAGLRRKLPGKKSFPANFSAGTKRCNSCMKTKRIDQFYKAHKSRDGLQVLCKVCSSRKQKEHLKSGRLLYQYHLRRCYRISLEAYDALNKSQGGKCAICKQRPLSQLHVDHDHNGAGAASVRGLLCRHCNHMLGAAKDDPDRLRAALRYLASPPAKRILLNLCS